MSTKLRYLLLFVFAAPLMACAAAPLKYSAESIEARVVDAETKQPLEGVIITANWQLEEGTFGGNVQAGQLNVMETTTGQDGKFHFSGWGPQKVAKGHLVNRDPQLLLFKSGYGYLRLVNKYSSDRELRLRPVRRSQWNGKTIEIKPFKGTAEEYAEHVYDLSSEMDSMHDYARGAKSCGWKSTPRMLTTLHNLSIDFEKRSIRLKAWRLGQRIHRISDIPIEPQCGSPMEFFRSYLP